jgi:hypothetical protein
MNRLFTVCLVPLTLASSPACAGFDHELPLDQNGIWARQYQTGLEDGVIALEVVGSVWFGQDQSPDLSYSTATGLASAFTIRQ